LRNCGHWTKVYCCGLFFRACKSDQTDPMQPNCESESAEFNSHPRNELPPYSPLHSVICSPPERSITSRPINQNISINGDGSRRLLVCFCSALQTQHPSVFARAIQLNSEELTENVLKLRDRDSGAYQIREEIRSYEPASGKRERSK